MDPRSYWNHYVSQHGGPAGTARRLGIPFQTIASICNGNRGIGRKTARRMAEQDTLLDEKILIWVTAADAPSARNPAATQTPAFTHTPDPTAPPPSPRTEPARPAR